MTLPDSGLATTYEAADNKVVSTYNSLNTVLCRCAQFDMENATGKSTILGIIDASCKAGVPDEKLAEMPAAFTTGFKAYFSAYFTLTFSMRAQSKLRQYARVAQKKIAVGAGLDLWHDTEWNDAVREFDMSGIIRLPWVDELINEMQPVIDVAQGNTYRNFPNSIYLLWAPSLTITEYRTMLQTLVSNSSAAADYCSKLGISYIQNATIDKILAGEGPRIRAMDWEDPKWIFWAVHGWVVKYHTNMAASTYMYASKYDGAVLSTSDANWWTKTFYFWKIGEDGKPVERPYSLYGWVRFLYPYAAVNNLLGCTEVANVVADALKCLGSSDTVSDNDWIIGRVATRDQAGTNADKFYFFTYHATDNPFIFMIAYFGLSANTTDTFTKDINDGATVEFNEMVKHSKWELEYYPSSYIEITNYAHEYKLFRMLIRGIQKVGSPLRKPARSKGDTAVPAFTKNEPDTVAK